MSLQEAVARAFDPGAGLAQSVEEFSPRTGQTVMAQAVAATMESGGILVVEAGTGVGKTFAYLVPALLSGERVLLSTATKTLQDQLFGRDIPRLIAALGMPVRTALLKGRSSYLCLHRLADARQDVSSQSGAALRDLARVEAWSLTTRAGDLAELIQIDERSAVIPLVTSTRENCLGAQCPQVQSCHVNLARREAMAADVVVINHHLFFADLAVKEEDYGGIIPDYAAVIFDEAHEIEEVAGSYFGVSISNYQVIDLVRDISAVTRRKNVSGEEIDRVLISLQDLSDSFFVLFPTPDGRAGFTGQQAFLDEHEEHYHDLLITFELLETTLKLIHDAPEELIPLVRRTRFLRDALAFWMESGSRELVYWIERRGRGVYLQATPIDVSQVLTERLFNQIDTIILTSATIAVSGSFDFVQKRLGLRGNRAQLVPSHFDYEKQALLYIPQTLPDPRTPGFGLAAAEEIIDLLHISKGRAFVLFTSNVQMKLAYERVSMRIPYESLLQGTGPRNALLEEFKNTPNCVLFATYSFWQGVDVPGEQLSCVIIDKLPFAVPSDPIVEARVAMIREQGGNPFYDYQIPQAAIALKQGFGRLIRSKSDRGVLALLDHRITKQRYGQIFFDSLPDYSFTVKKSEVEKFFECSK